MTYKLLRHKDFTAEWEKLPSAIRDQFKKKLAKVIEQPHIPKNMLKGDLAGCYKIKLFSVHDKFHRTLILSGFCFLKIAKISLNSSFFPKPIKC